MPRPQSLPMDNPHTAETSIQRVREEVPQCQLRLRDSQPVKIDLGLHPILSATKLPQDGHLHTGAVVDEFIASGEFRIAALTVEALEEDRMSIRATESRHGHRSTPFCHWSLSARQPFDILYSLSKKPNVIFVVGCGAHATSAESPGRPHGPVLPV